MAKRRTEEPEEPREPLEEFTVRYEAIVRGSLVVAAPDREAAEEKVRTQYRRLERRDVDDIRILGD